MLGRGKLSEKLQVKFDDMAVSPEVYAEEEDPLGLDDQEDYSCWRRKLLLPKHPLVKKWEIFVNITLFIGSMLNLFMVAFDSTNLGCWITVYLVDFIQILDIIKTCCTAYVNEKGMLITKRRLIIRRYLRTHFPVDLLSTLPTEVFVFAMTSYPTYKALTLLRLNRLLRIYKVIVWFGKREEELATNHVLSSFVKYTFMCIISTHAVTCLWYTLACEGNHAGTQRHCKPNSWATTFDLGFNMTTAGSLDTYVVSLYWAVATVTYTGFGDIYPANVEEKWFAVVAMMLGMMVFYGMLLGGMTSILTNLGTRRAKYMHRLNAIKKYLSELGISSDLIRQAVGYYEYLWLRKKGTETEGVYDQMPLSFQAEISYATTKGILEKSEIFKGMGEGVLRMLSLNISHRLYLPNQIVIKRGDVGTQMYFIHKGAVEVLSEDDEDTPVAILKSGKLFGEMSLILSMPRTATIRASTHCDLMVLDKQDFSTILLHYPEIAKRIYAEAMSRCKTADEVLVNEEQSVIEQNPHFKALQRRTSSFVEPSTDRRVSFQKNLNKNSGSSVVLKGNLESRNTIKLSETVVAIQTDTQDQESLRQLVRKHTTVDIKTKVNEIDCTFSVHPKSHVSTVWRLLVIFAALFLACVTPYMACFSSYSIRDGYFDSHHGSALLALSYVVDFIFLLDIIVHARTSILTPYGISSNCLEIMKVYMLSWQFVVDLLSVAPIEIACLVEEDVEQRKRLFAMLRMNRLLKCFKIFNHLNTQEKGLDVHIGITRAMKLFLFISLFTHWLACVFYPIACYSDCKTDSWLMAWATEKRNLSHVNETGPSTEYIASMYLTAATMTSTGYGDLYSRTNLGRFISVNAMIVGLLLYGYCLALMAATLANADAPRVNYQEKVFAVKNFMKERKLSTELQSRVIEYLSMMWEKYHGEWMPGQKSFIHDTPEGLQQDISLEDCQNTVAMAPLFRQTDDSFLSMLALQSTTYSFNPSEVILYAGEMGREMYCIRKGFCQVKTADGGTLLTEIGPGQYFGEIGMLFGDYRTAMVLARTHVEAVMINMQNLEDAMAEFPLLAEQFLRAQENKAYLRSLQKIAIQRATSCAPAHDVEAAKSALPKALSVGRRKESVDWSFRDSVFEFKKKKIPTQSIPMTQINDVEMPSRMKRDSVVDYNAPFEELPLALRIISCCLMRRTFGPHGRVLKVMTIIMVILSVLSSIVMPLLASFFYDDITLWIINYAIDITAFVNIYINCHTAYYNKENVLVTHPLATARHYLKSNFLLDLLSCLPIEFFIFTVHPNLKSGTVHMMGMARWNRMLQLYKLPLAFNYLESNIDKETGNIRSIKFMFYTVIFMNLLTCVVYVLGCPPDMGDSAFELMNMTAAHCSSNSWLGNTAFFNYHDPWTMYGVSFYWASATAVSVGYGEISAFTDVEMCVAMLIMVVGVLFFGYIIASVAASLANADAQRARYQEKLTSIKMFLEDFNINKDLQKRIEAHYQYVWLRTRGVEPQSLLEGLPISLWGDVTLSLYQENINKISLFKDTEVSFIKMLSRYITPLFILKGEYVVKKHDIGEEMFFIHRGAVDVTNEEGTMIFDTMRAGAAFGEVSLLFSCPRTASIRARTNCDIFSLAKFDFDRVVDLYPDIKEHVMKIAEERRQQAKQRSAEKLTKKDDDTGKEEKKKEEKTAEQSVNKRNQRKMTRGLGRGLSLCARDTEEEEELEREIGQSKHRMSRSSRSSIGRRVSVGPSIQIRNMMLEEEDEEEEEEQVIASTIVRLSEIEERMKRIEDSASEGSVSREGSHNDEDNAANENQSNNINKNNNDNEEETDEENKTGCMESLRRLNSFIISPQDTFPFRCFMCFINTILVWLVTYQSLFNDHHPAILALTYICDIILYVEIYVKFHMSYYDDFGDYVEDRAQIFKMYTRAPGGLPLDAMSVLPLDILAFAAPPGKRLLCLGYLRLLRVLRLYHVTRFFSRWEKELNINMLMVRLCRYFVTITLLLHFLSSIWVALACPLMECNANSWLSLVSQDEKSGMGLYCNCVYWCLATMTSTGYGDIRPVRIIEMIYSSFVMITGKLMFGFVLGNIASTLANAEINKIRYKEKLDSARDTMEDQVVPLELQSRVCAYFDYLWLRNKGVDSKSLFRDAPTCLVAELFYAIAHDMFKAIPLFEQADASFLRTLSLNVNQMLFMPGDYIVKKDDVGAEVMYVLRGEADVIREGNQIEGHLDAGDILGEINLVRNLPRRVSVRARTHVDVLSLSSDDLMMVLEHYPAVHRNMVTLANERFSTLLRETESMTEKLGKYRRMSTSRRMSTKTPIL